MYQRILVPVDGTECSDAALKHGLRLAREQGAGVRLIHVRETQWLCAYGMVPSAYADAVSSAWLYADEVMLHAVDEARRAGIEVPDVRVVEANGQRVADLIVAEADRWPADLIVMGTHGRHGIRHLLLGGVAEGVMHATSVPILLVHVATADAMVRVA
jgi:nucleotide-binding universal stress UspA family protein